jgi:hypothetical protein
LISSKRSVPHAAIRILPIERVSDRFQILVDDVEAARLISQANFFARIANPARMPEQ